VLSPKQRRITETLILRLNNFLVELGVTHRYHTSGILILQIEASFTNSLALYRYDTIFDYGNDLKDIRAVKLLNLYFGHLTNVLQPEMQEKNEQRKDDGYLTYPYFIPRWLPNGIQT